MNFQKLQFKKSKFIFGIIAIIIGVLIIWGTTRAQTLQDGDIVRTAASPALYLIQNGQKRVFPHASVYHSWGLPRDFSTVEVISDLSAYPEANPVSFRDGSLFRGKTISLHGKEASAVFFVSDGKLRPVKSSEVYQKLFNDPNWGKVKWIPDDLLSKFAYPMGETIENADQHPDGCLVKYKGTAVIYLIEAGKLRPIKSSAFEANRLSQQEVIEIESAETYETASEIKAGEEKLTLSIPTVIAASNTTFLKSYRLLVFTKINGAWPTKDGGYIVSGTTDPNIMFIPPDGFVAKLDKQGDIQWLKLLKTKNATGGGNMMNPLGEEDVQSIIELKNGGYLMASYVDGFTTNKEFDTDMERNKILLTRLDKNGNLIWNKSFTAFVEAARNSLLETNDHGFLFYAPIADLEPNKRGEDSDVYQDQPYASLKVFKFDLNGNLQWSKNIKNFISRKSDTYLTTTADGGYALVGNIAEVNTEKELPYNFDTYPGLAKFDKNFNFEWAKSLEGIPLEMAAAIPKPDGGFELGWKKVRQGAIITKGLARTEDDGYLVLGQWSGGLSLMTNSVDLKSPVKGYLIAFKFGSSGNLEWVKKMTLNFNEFTAPMIDFSVSLTTDKKVMMVGPITWADDDYREKTRETNEQIKWYKEKYGEAEMAKEEKDKSKQSQQDWKKVKATIKATQDAFRAGIFMMKTDQELNISWAKVVNPQRGITNYVIKPTSDSGAIIGGEYETAVVKSVILDSITYFKDGFLMKLDASGNIKDNNNWIIDYNGEIVTEMMTPYAIANDLTIEVKPYSTKLTNRQPEFSLYNKAKTTAYAPFNSSKDTLPPVTPAVSAYETPIQNSTLASTAKRTWPQIHYERAVPGELMNDKSRTVHDELLLILNQLYNNQVKMTDNMDGAMLYYVFSRMITRDDLTAIKDHLEGLGYKTQDQGFYDLTTYKSGYFLILTFSTNNADKAFLKVTY